MKKTLVLLLSLTLMVVFVGTGIAFDKKGNEKKGKYYFRKNCRVCHQAGKSAPPLSPNSKTQAQWERAFEKHERLECADEWKKLSEDKLNDILTYLYNHAFDSPSPATCG